MFKKKIYQYSSIQLKLQLISATTNKNPHILTRKLSQHGFRQQTVAQDTRFTKSSLSIRHIHKQVQVLSSKIDSFENSLLFKWLRKEAPLISNIGLEGFKLSVFNRYGVIQSIETGRGSSSSVDSSFYSVVKSVKTKTPWHPHVCSYKRSASWVNEYSCCIN